MFEVHPDLTRDLIWRLGWFWLGIGLANAIWAIGWLRRAGTRPAGGVSERVAAWFWLAAAGAALAVGVTHLTYQGPPQQFWCRLPEPFKDAVDLALGNPVAYFALWVVGLWAAVRFRRWLVRPFVAWSFLNAFLVFFVLSLTDWDFRQIVGKPDNIAIVGMLVATLFFTWLYFRRAVENDTRLSAGRPVLEAQADRQILVWPDLVYIELICMVLLTAGLILWAVAVKAPLEEPASPTTTPNPAKAPWYFLGLQELLVYFDPWLAGVVFPGLIIVGLMAVPYLDYNPKGNGYYTFEQRPFAVSGFLFGFLVLWISLIGLGTFLRGPNWNFFGIYERWDVHKVEVLNNVNLSDYFYAWAPSWVPWSGPPPSPPEGTHGLSRVPYILLRELPGLALLTVYFLVLPVVLATTAFRKAYLQMGFLRYVVFVYLFLGMLLLPLKMLLRWAFNIKYIVAVPEWMFNI